jgi:hypothetical protein
MDKNSSQPSTHEQEITHKLQGAVVQLEKFRKNLYQYFSNRADTLMDLVDALAGNTAARSPAELSLSVLFRREYSSVYDAIENLFVVSDPEKAAEERQTQEQELVRLIAGTLPQPQQRKFWLFGIDVTPIPRRFAETLADRKYIHQPNTLKGNKPVTIGHDASILAALPEKESPTDAPWVVPLNVRRVTSDKKAGQAAAEQIRLVVTDEKLPFHKALCVNVEDSGYSGIPHLGEVADIGNLVTVARLPGNRVVYRQPGPFAEGGGQPVGHPTWYGKPFKLKDPETWGPPDEETQTSFTTRKGRTYPVELQGWHNLVRRGKKDLPMYRYPFTLVRARVLDTDGKLIHKQEMWLLVIGERRNELSLIEIWEAYGRRYDLEHFFRFGKQRLLLTAFQTPEETHEENWWQIVQLAYILLWLSRSVAVNLPNPWERYLPQAQNGVASPAVAQRSFERIIRQIGTPAAAPKRRGNSSGRRRGTKIPPRERLAVVKMAAKQPVVA